MKSNITLAVWAGNTIGGTEKAAVLFAVALAGRGHRVIFLGPPGPRDGALSEGKVPRIAPPHKPAELAELFRAQQVGLLHRHVTGYEDTSLILETLSLMDDQRPRLIETNVFGGMEDPAWERWVDFRCFVSRSNAVQTFMRRRRALNAESLATRTVIFNPLVPLSPTSRAGSRRMETRQELGVQPDEILALRIGREGTKWCEDEVIAFQQARRKNNRLRLLLMEPRSDIWADVERGRWGDGIVLRRATSDFEQLAAVYSAGDLMLHMSVFGESYGYTIAEAMQHGLPVLVKSTPWQDNAQVELVEHGMTGFVCGSPEGAADALLQLAASPALRERFGAAGRERIAGLSNLDNEAELLDEIMKFLALREPLKKVAERNRQLLAFRAGFAARERRVWELDAPRFGITYLKGVWYLVYRALRNFFYQLKVILRRS